jgi:uncharacterized protein YbbK (DUF523 family)
MAPVIREPVVVSACLLGLKTRYDGDGALSPEALKMLKGMLPIPACPEQLGGLSTPRPRAEITKGDGYSVLDGRSKVADENGKDVTELFLRGAAAVLTIARLSGAKKAFLKEKSPSCGVSLICRGSECIPGSGVAAALLKREGLQVTGF